MHDALFFLLETSQNRANRSPERFKGIGSMAQSTLAGENWDWVNEQLFYFAWCK
jgi:hypothetical protein